jgi:hypothetical protein
MEGQPSRPSAAASSWSRTQARSRSVRLRQARPHARTTRRRRSRRRPGTAHLSSSTLRAPTLAGRRGAPAPRREPSCWSPRTPRSWTGCEACSGRRSDGRMCRPSRARRHILSQMVFQRSPWPPEPPEHMPRGRTSEARAGQLLRCSSWSCASVRMPAANQRPILTGGTIAGARTRCSLGRSNRSGAIASERESAIQTLRRECGPAPEPPVRQGPATEPPQDDRTG